MFAFELFTIVLVLLIPPPTFMDPRIPAPPCTTNAPLAVDVVIAFPVIIALFVIAIEPNID